MEVSQKANIESSATLQDLIADKIELLKTVDQQIPAVTIVHNVQTQSVIYMSPLGLKILDTTLESLKALGSSYHDIYFNPHFAEIYVTKIFGLLKRNNNDEVISYFQQVRSAPGKDWTWYLTCSKIFLRDDTGNPVLLISNAVPMDANHYLEAAKAQRLLDENAFLQKNEHLFKTLTVREREILVLMAKGFSTNEIAEQLFIAYMTAHTHRRNIKKKLNAESHYEISKFALAFGLI